MSTRAEVGIAGGSAVLGQNLPWKRCSETGGALPRRAGGSDLDARVQVLLAAERARYIDLLGRPGPQRLGTADTLRDAARRVDDLRFAAQSSAQLLGGASPAVLSARGLGRLAGGTGDS